MCDSFDLELSLRTVLVQPEIAEVCGHFNIIRYALEKQDPFHSMEVLFPEHFWNISSHGDCHTMDLDKAWISKLFLQISKVFPYYGRGSIVPVMFATYPRKTNVCYVSQEDKPLSKVMKLRAWHSSLKHFDVQRVHVSCFIVKCKNKMGIGNLGGWYPG